MVKKVYNVGDLLFAKVKGYPPWPAKITEVKDKGRYAVFFYGTYENAVLKSNELFEFSRENQDNFINKNKHRKNYTKGLIELLNNPDIAPGETRPLPANTSIYNEETLTSSPAPASSTSSATSPVLSSPTTPKKPFKLSDGTPVNRSSQSFKTPSSEAAPSPLAPTSQRRGTKRGAPEESPAAVSSPSQQQQQTSSRSGRVIKQKRFSDDEHHGKSSTSGELLTKADTQIDDPRKIWVKRRSTGDLIEIQLDKEKPAGWLSERQKLSWNLATARNATKLKEFVELGRFIPEEVVQALKEKTELTEEEKEDLRKVAEQKIRREKMSWLMREHDIINTEISIKKCLNTQDPDTDEAVRQLQKLLRMDLDKFMLIKQPSIVDTLTKLKRYKGPKVELEFPDQKEAERVRRNYSTIQSMADTMYKKVLALYGFKKNENSEFQEFLEKEVSKFHEATNKLTLDQRLVLTQMP